MRYLCVNVAFVTTILILASASAQTKTDLSRDQLVGPVHTVQVEFAQIAMINGKEVEIERGPHQRVVYDRRGNEIERINFNKDGSIENRTVHIIDANGHISGWEEYEAETAGKGERITNRSEWLYDAKGNRIEARVYSGRDLSHRTTASYNTAGLIIEETMITDGGAWKQTKKYGYDSGGRLTSTLVNTNGTTELIEQTYNDSGNRISYKYSGPGEQNNSVAGYVFDGHGREIERTSEDIRSKAKVVTFYDSQGRVIRRVTHFDYKQPNIIMSHAPEPGTVEFRYNDSNQLVEERVYSAEGTLRRRTVYEYEGDGRIRSQSYFKGDSTVVGKIMYEYDRRGNYVKMLNVSSDQNGKPVTHVEHRLLTYYDNK